MGQLSISLLERDGDPIPENVEGFRAPDVETYIDESRIALRLAQACFAMLTLEQKEVIRDAARVCARHKCGAEQAEGRALYRLLTGDDLPC
jgi:hypothetical protein